MGCPLFLESKRREFYVGFSTLHVNNKQSKDQFLGLLSLTYWSNQAVIVIFLTSIYI